MRREGGREEGREKETGRTRETRDIAIIKIIMCNETKTDDSSACPAALRDACSAVPRSYGPQTAPIGLPACDARPLDVRVRGGSRQGQAGRPGHATARWPQGAGCGGGGAEARGGAAG